MTTPPDALATLIAKDQIRELAMLYSRGVDRKDIELLKSLYTADATDDHGPYYNGPVEGYIAFLEQSLPHMHIGGHFICNHLVSVDGDAADGEVYAIAWHLIPDGKGGLLHDMQAVRYIDNYARENGKWRFAKRVVTFDMKVVHAANDHGEKPDPAKDPSYTELSSHLFRRGPRT